MILVTGATGSVGSGLLPLLARSGSQARALVRSPAALARMEGQDLEAVEGDFDRPADLEPAMVGCDRILLLSPPHPDQVTREKAAIHAAGRAGVWPRRRPFGHGRRPRIAL